MVCRCKQSKPNKMSTVFLAILSFISYMYSALTTCSNVFCFPEGNESSQMHIPLLSVLFTLSEHMHIPMEALTFLFLEQTAQFSLLKMRSQNSNVPLANRKAASLPSPPPPPKFSVHLIRWKLLPDHSLALSLTLNVCGTCSTRQQFSCYWKKHRCLQPKSHL